MMKIESIRFWLKIMVGPFPIMENVFRLKCNCMQPLITSFFILIRVVVRDMGKSLVIYCITTIRVKIIMMSWMALMPY